MYKTKILPALVLLFLSSSLFAQVVNNASQLASAISAATPGTTITLADGTWNNVAIIINKNGNAANPITVAAQTAGQVILTGNSRVYMSGSHITVTGLVFQNPANLTFSGSELRPVFDLQNCDSCKVLNNKIDGYNGTVAQKAIKHKWVRTEGGQFVEIAHNSFLNKFGVGSIIVTNRSSAGTDFLKIHHNYFADRTPINGFNDDNDQDAIRIGTSTTSLSNSFTEVYDNYFYNFFGEIEIISNKSGENKYYNNTFRKYSGGLTLRHGDNCDVYGNYFFAENNHSSGGVRVIGEGHKVYNNYIEGIKSSKANGSNSNSTGGINVVNGKPNSALNEYYQVKNAQIVNNTFVNCDYGLRIGMPVNSTLTLAPQNLTVANNIAYNTSINPYSIVTPPTGNSVSQGNQTNLASGNLVDDGNFHRIVSGSSAIDASVGTYAYVVDDVLTGSRDANVDAGAEEFGGNGTKLPYTAADVGVNVGFTTILIPAIGTTPASLTFGECSPDLTFDVSSNVPWTITENLPWLSLDVPSGNGQTTVTATVTQNTSGASRAGNISIVETGGSTTALLPVTQLSSALDVELPIVGATSIGMFSNSTPLEANAYDDDVSTFVTGNIDTEPEVSITFDLGTICTLNSVGINFLNAQVWQSNFRLAIATNPAGPFTLAILSASSGPPASVTVDTVHPYALNGVSARYVKFISLGNSSSSNNFLSIANIDFTGHIDCANINPCPNLIVENGNPVPMSLYQAIEIQSAGTVSQPDVLFEAEDCILLQTGFEVTPAAMFEAVLVNCN